MQFSLPQTALSSALEKIAIALENRHELESYTIISLRVSGQALTVAAVGLASRAQGKGISCISCHTRLDLISSDGFEGGLCVSGKLLKNMIAQFPEALIDFKLDGNTLFVKAGRGRYRLKTTPLDMFPPFGADYSQVEWRPVSFGKLLGAMRKVEFCSDDGLNARDYSRGVYIDQDFFVATDGARLSMYGQDFVELPTPAIVPEASASRIVKIYRGCGDNGAYGFSLGAGNRVSQLHFRNEDIFVTTALLAADFPNYRSVVPGGYPCAFTCRKGELITALKRCALMSEDAGEHVLFQFTPDECRVSVSGKFGEGEELVEITEGAGEVSIILNGKFVREVVERLDEDTVFWQLPQGTGQGPVMAPALIKEGNYANIILPRRANPQRDAR